MGNTRKLQEFGNLFDFLKKGAGTTLIYVKTRSCQPMKPTVLEIGHFQAFTCEVEVQRMFRCVF